MDDLFSDAVRQLLADQCTPQVVRSIEAGASPVDLWSHLEDAGFLDALVPESLDGAGLSLRDVYPVLELCGTFAVPVPFGETLLARALVSESGARAPGGPISFGDGQIDAEGCLRCSAVRSGKVCDWVLVSHEGKCRLLPVASARVAADAFCLDATLIWPLQVWKEAMQVPVKVELRYVQAALYAAMTAGALMHVFNCTLQYANDRQQFGKPIGKFQAIQHQLSVMSEHAFAARMAAQLGLSSEGLNIDRLRVAIAKARTSEAALEVAALSHSIHGAIGFTVEFDLQLFTRRLHLWRQAAGSESYWHDVVGAALLDSASGMSLNLIRTATDMAIS